MNEHAPQPEKKYGDMVPEYVFEDLAKSNFLLPEKQEFRDGIREKYEAWSHYGVIHMAEHKKVKAVLSARIAAIKAYDAEMLKAK